MFDPWEFKEKNESLGWVDFLEAVARVADHASLRNKEEVQQLGYESSYELFNAMMKGLVPFTRRNSYGYEPKTRPLHLKVRHARCLLL